MHLFCAPRDTGTALSLFAGTGCIADSLANYFSDVYAAAFRPELVEFMRLRFRQDSRDNINVLQADPLKLPFEPESFDLVSIDGGFVPLLASSDARTARRDIPRFLSACNSLLKSGGRITMGVANRLSPDCLVRWRLPRPNLLFGAHGYVTLLRNAGFQQVRLFSAFPQHIFPQAIVPFEDHLTLLQTLDSIGGLPRRKIRNLAMRVLLRTGIYKYFIGGFFLVGDKT
jgi:SAM-dependent methyltransferase